VAGPGFINLTLRDDWIEAQTTKLANDSRLGIEPLATKTKCIIDFSAPNIAKPMHVGHLRSTVIGDALCRIYRALGYDVTSDNHIGDWGTQFGMIIYGYKHFLDDEAFKQAPVAELARLYQLVNRLCDYFEACEGVPRLKAELEERRGALEAAKTAAAPNDKNAAKSLRKLQGNLDELAGKIAAAEVGCREVEENPELAALVAAHPQILIDSRRETAKLHANDPENRALWEQFLPECLDALQGMYDRLGIRFDLSLGESFYQPMLANVVESLEKKKLARESEGAICVFLDGHEAPFIVRKGDGAFTYATTDLATIRYRVETLNADMMLYVVDARQSEHFRALFQTARLWGFDRLDLRHISFGTILGDDKRPFKTRSGGTVGLESLIDEAISRARQIVNENDDAKEAPELDEATRQAVAEVVGIGGIKYADLHHNRESDYVFSWEKMLAKTGDTATYIQYSYARICGIFRKGGINRDEFRGSGHRVTITHPSERKLIVHLNRLPEVLEAVVADNRPNLLTQHLFETADRFTAFYENCIVLKEENKAIRNSRLVLCDLTARTLKQGLELLGIGTAEQM
jgi:arginyl-tRNA synthetase